MGYGTEVMKLPIRGLRTTNTPDMNGACKALEMNAAGFYYRNETVTAQFKEKILSVGSPASIFFGCL